MSDSNQALVQAAIDLLESGDEEGCEGLVVVTAESYRCLQAAVRAAVGQGYGIVVRQNLD